MVAQEILHRACGFPLPSKPKSLTPDAGESGHASKASRRGFGAKGHVSTAVQRYIAATPRGHLLDFDASKPYIGAMTKLLDEAVEAVRRLPSDDQDDIARAIIQLAGSDLPAPVVLSPEEREAIARSKAAADRGEFATSEQVRAVWAKHGL